MKYELHDKGTDKLLEAVKAAIVHFPPPGATLGMIAICPQSRMQVEVRARRHDRVPDRNLKHST